MISNQNTENPKIPCKSSMVELFTKIVRLHLTINYFHKRTPSEMFDRAINTFLMMASNLKNETLGEASASSASADTQKTIIILPEKLRKF